MPPPEILPLFAVPFAYSHHPDPARLNAALRAFALAQEARGSGGANPRPLTTRNAALYESHFNLFRDPDPAIQELKRHCWEQLLHVVGQLSNYDQKTVERLQIYNDAWVHVTRRGGFFGLHNHPNASWSGVYCVDPGRSDPGNPESGALTFVNPMMVSSMYMDAAVARIPPPYGFQIRSAKLAAGQLVIFPSYLLHDVKPFEGEGERITIAFNCWFTLPDA